MTRTSADATAGKLAGHPFLSAVRSRTGHFRTESGYHTDVWMDLETLCRQPSAIRPFAAALATRLKP